MRVGISPVEHPDIEASTTGRRSRAIDHGIASRKRRRLRGTHSCAAGDARPPGTPG
jgi:hypothetical protein